jgi:hypothetical protein
MGPTNSQIDVPYEQLQEALSAAKDRAELYQVIATAPFTHKVEMALLFLGFISFFILDDTKQTVRLVAVSDTEYYQMSVQGYNFDLASYVVPLDDSKNSIAKAIKTGKPQSTTDWGVLGRTRAEDAARFNQANSGIAYTAVYPFSGKLRGALMYNYYQYQDAIGPQQHEFMKRYTIMVSSALDKNYEH